MSLNQRCVLPGCAYHLTHRGANDQKVFFSPGDRSAYLSLVRENMADAGVRVLAWCLMENHVHLVVVPETEDSLEALLRRVHGRYAHMVNVRKGRTGPLWQNRFRSCPVAEERLGTTVAYVELNPVRAGLVAVVEDYRWSSAAAHLGLEKDTAGLLDRDFWLRQGGAEAWRDVLVKGTDPLEWRLLRRCTYAGRPFGGEEFVAEFEARFQRKWRRWGFETGRKVERFVARGNGAGSGSPAGV